MAAAAAAAMTTTRYGRIFVRFSAPQSGKYVGFDGVISSDTGFTDAGYIKAVRDNLTFRGLDPQEYSERQTTFIYDCGTTDPNAFDESKAFKLHYFSVVYGQDTNPCAKAGTLFLSSYNPVYPGSDKFAQDVKKLLKVKCLPPILYITNLS